MSTFATLLCVCLVFINTVQAFNLRFKREDNYCYSKDPEHYVYASTLTGYEFVRKDVRNLQIPRACKPVMFWHLNRHGTRYPSESEIKTFSKLKDTLAQVQENVKQGRGELCEEDYKLLQTWVWNTTIDSSKAKFLAPQGYEDLYGIAKRYKKKFPSLLGAKYSDDYYYFQNTKTERTKNSFASYVRGLFGDDVTLEGKESDQTIREFASCKKWTEEVAGNKDKRAEYIKFTKTAQYENMRQRISKRLGFTTTLEGTVILAMYLDCAFEQAWNVHGPSKWCTAFTKEDLKFMEYGGDLLTYYKNGYGSAEYNGKLGCPILKDLYDKLNKKVTDSKSKQPKVTALFTHSTAYQQFMVTLGLRKDDKPLLGTNFNDVGNRLWRVSAFAPFATNFAAVLYQCEDYNNEYKIQFLENEVPLELFEECSKGLCSWRAFKRKFKTLVESCSLDFCDK